MDSSFRAPIDQLRPTVDTGPGLTKQSHRDECDINKIIAKYQREGISEFANKWQGFYGEVDSADFQTAMDLMVNANAMFMELPSAVRNRFNQDPGQFVDFAQNPDNIEELRNMGLAPRPGTENTAEPAAEPVTEPPA